MCDLDYSFATTSRSRMGAEDFEKLFSSAGRDQGLQFPLMATPATEANIKAIAEEKAKRTEQRKLAGKRLEAAAKAVEGAEAVVAAKANEQGHLFGSVTAREIAANLREQGFQITDKMVQLPEHIKEVGTHTVALRFSEELTTTVNVVVVAERAAEEAAEETSETADEAQKL